MPLPYKSFKQTTPTTPGVRTSADFHIVTSQNLIASHPNKAIKLHFIYVREFTLCGVVRVGDVLQVNGFKIYYERGFVGISCQDMEGFLRVEATTATLPHSPTNSFLADEVASTCPLLTPSPPTNDLINPLPESEQPTFVLGKELTHKLKHVTGKAENSRNLT